MFINSSQIKGDGQVTLVHGLFAYVQHMLLHTSMKVQIPLVFIYFLYFLQCRITKKTMPSAIQQVYKDEELLQTQNHNQ